VQKNETHPDETKLVQIRNRCAILIAVHSRTIELIIYGQTVDR